MENGHFFRNLLLTLIGLAVAGVLAWWLIKALFSLIFYVLVGALVVGGVVYIYGKAKRSLTGGRQRQIRH